MIFVYRVVCSSAVADPDIPFKRGGGGGGGGGMK